MSVVLARNDVEEAQRNLLTLERYRSVAELSVQVTHDFNNMMQAVLGNAALAKMDAPQGGPMADSLAAIEAAAGKANRRNGYSKKTVLGESSKLELRIPRDREGTFDPKLIAKYQRRFPGFDEKIISMYAHGMSAREIVGHLRELYGIEVSPDLISAVTDAVLEEIAAWQARPPQPSR